MTQDKNELDKEEKESDKGIGFNKWWVWGIAFVFVIWWKWDDVHTWFNQDVFHRIRNRPTIITD